jgi:hypothetical protein
MKQIRAIQTKYAGYHFRSRLEARWAVFFDRLEIKWEYEKQGYNLPYSGNYLPDFWLPEYKQWIEIKGAIPAMHWMPVEEEEKIAELARETGHPSFLFFGLPDFDVPFAEYRPNPLPYYQKNISSDRGVNIVNWCPTHLLSAEWLGAAIDAAKSSRFEFGESGATL